MRQRTLSWKLVFRALFMDGDAYDEMRDDDNPFVEGLFLLVLVGASTALLHLVGRSLMWASTPQLASVQQAILDALQQSPWWSEIAASPEAVAKFTSIWEAIWRFTPILGGAAISTSALNLVLWPVGLILSWLAYGSIAHLFGRMLGGAGSFQQTLGVLSLSFAPAVFRGLGLIPFFVMGGVLSVWQLILRYQALRSAHGLPWQRAFWATVLPYAVFAAFGALLGVAAGALFALIAGR
jgi:hypothetical protein